jgi:hypothetical protein
LPACSPLPFLHKLVSLTTPPVVAKAEAKADAADVKAASAETKADIKG